MENIDVKDKIAEMKIKLIEKIEKSFLDVDRLSGEEAVAYAQAGDILMHNLESYSDMMMKTMEMMKSQNNKPDNPNKEGDNWDKGFFGC